MCVKRLIVDVTYEINDQIVDKDDCWENDRQK